jgi:hypothetical protein
VSHLVGDAAEMRQEAIPLRGHLGRRLHGVVPAEAEDEQAVAPDEARRGDRNACGSSHGERLLSLKAIDTAALAQLFGRQAEVLAKGPRERFVRAVAGIERHRKNVGCAAGQLRRRLAQPAGAGVGRERLSGRDGKRA